MDWSKVQKEHVDAAIQKFIDEKPEHPEPRSYYLLYNGEKLPSKYIRGLAYSIATGEPINLAGFNGGVETVNFFKKYGYTVESVNVEGQKRKYPVNDAVWIATALLAYEAYITIPNACRKDMYFKQAAIVHKAQEIADGNVDAARVSWWVNADNEKSTQNYLREDLEEDNSTRRLSKMDEYEEKTYPSGLDMTDILSVGEEEITMGDLFSFVKENYPAVLEVKQVSEINYLGILEYLKNNRELPYADPEKPGLTEEQKKAYLAVKKNGQDIVTELKKIYELCSNKYGLTRCEKVSWDDGSHQKTRKYLWVPMKYGDKSNRHESISIFVEMITQDKPVFRVSLELRNDKTKAEDVKKYHTHLDIPVNTDAGLVYVSGSNELGRPDKLTESQDVIKQKVENKEYDKVQICKYISADNYPTNEDIEAGILGAVEALLPYYEYVVGAASQKRVWLLTWNPDNWNWEDYEEVCVSTKEGKTTVIPWTCASKQPVIGDEVFLIKTGKQPRGIIAHGHVEKAAYDAPHYDPEKAAAGTMTGHIDAEYDWIQHYENEGMLLQDDLKEKFPQQQWSPMGSGIEIKSEVIPELRKMWNALIGKDEYWPSYKEYPVDLTKDDWKKFIEEVEYPSHKGCMRVLKCFLDIGGIASPKTLAEKYKGHPTVYTSSVYNTSRRALEYFKMAPCPDGDTQRYFPIAFLGKRGSEANSGTYVYKMRDELMEALKEMDLENIDLKYNKGEDETVNTSGFDKNMILYGPPGTGKTYSTAKYAVSICDGDKAPDLSNYPAVMKRYRELMDEHRIAFVTFHQSYGYEEFIEGIKPVMDKTGSQSADAEGEKNNEIKYDVIDGVFKRFCDRARTSTVITKSQEGLISDSACVWKATVRSEVRQDCFDNNRVRIDWGFDSDGAAGFVEDIQKGDIIVTTDGSRTVINGIAVVATDEAEELNVEGDSTSRQVVWLAKDINENIKTLNKNKILHRKTVARVPNMAAADIISLAKKLNPQDDVLSQTTIEENKKPYVFVIDEINRGNISKIFGELITLIEDTKREGLDECIPAILPYSGDEFTVPDNVYLLGTMNTADRSIALMDTALRRRFKFMEMLPDHKLLKGITIEDAGESLDVEKMLKIINERITYLYDREHTIGHAIFMKLTKEGENTLDNLASIFAKSVIPLLQEYFYEDYEKIRLVLGDNAKKDTATQFVIAEDVPDDTFEGDVSDEIDIPEKSYRIEYDNFTNIMAYKGISKKL